MKSYVSRLREKEWSMGNGQCPACGGLGPGFYHKENPKFIGRTVSDIGHSKFCLFARMMKDYGMNPVMLGHFMA